MSSSGEAGGLASNLQTRERSARKVTEENRRDNVTTKKRNWAGTVLTSWNSVYRIIHSVDSFQRKMFRRTESSSSRGTSRYESVRELEGKGRCELMCRTTRFGRDTRAVCFVVG